MAPRDTQAQQVSLLDRLIGDDSATKGTLGALSGQRALVDSIRRDLENLLNTRWRCRSWPPNLDELEKSVVGYGIADFCAFAWGDPNSHRELRRILEQTIKRFEPRLRNARVQLLDRGGKEDRMLRFKIEAEIVFGDTHRPVLFETSLDTLGTSFHVGMSV